MASDSLFFTLCIILLFPLSSEVSAVPIPLLLGKASEYPTDSVPLIQPSQPLLVDLDNNPIPIRSLHVGNQYMIAFKVTNHDTAKDWNSTIIVEVRNEYAETVMLNWQTRIIPANDSVVVGMSWIAGNSSSYTIRNFVVSSISEPIAYSNLNYTYFYTVQG